MLPTSITRSGAPASRASSTPRVSCTRSGARPSADTLLGAAETLNASGLRFLLEMGAPVDADMPDGLAPVAVVLEGYARDPAGKHACLELFTRHGVVLPDTPAMAVHRGRIDLLETHLRRDSRLLTRTFSHEEIYPPALGCHEDHSLALHATPLDGFTLLHLCVDYDETEIARWLLARGMPVDARAETDADGFGGHTALFGCVVAQARRMRDSDDFAALLLDHGADPDARASLRKRLRFVGDERMHEYRDVTPLSWGERFHERGFVSRKAMLLIAKRGEGTDPMAPKAEPIPVLIVGAGPTGLVLALWLTRLGVPVRIIDRAEAIGNDVASARRPGAHARVLPADRNRRRRRLRAASRCPPSTSG